MSSEFTPIAATACAVLVICMGLMLFTNHPFFHWLPASSVFLLVGVLTGMIERLAPGEDPFVTFNPDVFFDFLLPPIIFHAGLSLMKKNFFKNIGTILALALVGTSISSAFIFGVSRWFAPDLDTLEAGMFAVLISAVDPVAVLSLFEAYHQRCDQTAYALILGESLMNDAVCVVVFQALASFRHDTNVAMHVGRFLYLSVLSPVLGVTMGVMACLIYKHANLRSHVAIELGFGLLLGAYMPYLFAEMAGLSGIVTIFMSGIVMKHYSFKNLSLQAQTGLVTFSTTLAFIAEMLVFVYVGLGVIGARLKWDGVFIVYVILACLGARFLSVFVLVPICNKRRGQPVTLKQMAAMWFAGLRGAIAFALAAELAHDTKEEEEVFISTTLAVVMFTTFVLGGLADSFYNFLGMIGLDTEIETGPTLTEEEDKGRGIAPHETGYQFHVWWHKFDETVVQKFLCVSVAEHKRLETMPRQSINRLLSHPGSRTRVEPSFEEEVEMAQRNSSDAFE